VKIFLGKFFGKLGFLLCAREAEKDEKISRKIFVRGGLARPLPGRATE
jgi:hypothetical protein